MSLMRLIVGAGLFAAGYYFGKQAGRTEAIQGDYQTFVDLEPATGPGNDAPHQEKPEKNQ